MDLRALLAPDVKLNPFPLYAQMRLAAPVVYFEPYDMWSVFRYEDVKRVLSDHAVFSSGMGGGGDERGRSMISTDPPRHTKLRNLVSRAFTPRVVEGLRERIEALTEELLDPLRGAGEIDIIKDLSEPLPVMVIAELLGIPASDRRAFKIWSDMVVASTDNMLSDEASQDPAFGAAMADMDAYFTGVIEERRQRPRQDLISLLLASEIDGEGLTDEEILSFCWLLLVAGNETTTNLIGNACLTLLDHPEALRTLKDDPGLIPSAIEEVLRFRSPIQAMFRRARQDVSLSGQTVPEGAFVAAMIGSANRDPDAFDEPDTFEIARRPNPHIAFGFGVHYCLGAPLARLEATVALEAILSRLRGLRRKDDTPLEPQKGFIIHGVTGLSLAFDPARA